VTAASDTSMAAWQAVEDLDGSIVTGGTTIASTAQAIVAQTSLFDGLPKGRSGQLQGALNGATSASTARTASGHLAAAAALYDEGDRSTGLEASDVYGRRGDIIKSLATGLLGRVDGLPNATPDVFNGVRADVKGLAQLLQEAGSDLSRYLLADW